MAPWLVIVLINKNIVDVTGGIIELCNTFKERGVKLHVNKVKIMKFGEEKEIIGSEMWYKARGGFKLRILRNGCRGN